MTCFCGCSIGECLKKYEGVKWTGVDVSTVYDIDDYVPEFVQEVGLYNTYSVTSYKATCLQGNTKWIAQVMQLHMLISVMPPDRFDSAILQPLRVQTMGSVVVIVKCMTDISLAWWFTAN